ncbi:hypothetical protein PS627_04548 [Pseudomonas fluorescens]|nr:hypothetical protein PS627_04548 [Pseudomonas fluorescens]
MLQQQGDAAVLDHVGQAFLGVVRVQRQVGAAGLEDRQQGHDHLQRALGGDAHQHLRADAAPDQRQRQAIGSLVELAVAQLAVAEHQRHGLGRGLRLALEQALHAVFARVADIGVVPGLQGLLLAGIHQRQLAHPCLRVGHHAM